MNLNINLKASCDEILNLKFIKKAPSPSYFLERLNSVRRHFTQGNFTQNQISPIRHFTPLQVSKLNSNTLL
jgi:hypothetical protein